MQASSDLRNCPPQNNLVRRKLLKQPVTANDTDNRHQVALLHLVVDKVGQHFSHRDDVFKRNRQIIDHKSEHAPQILRREVARNLRLNRFARDFDRAFTPWLSRCFHELHELKVLFLTILE